MASGGDDRINSSRINEPTPFFLDSQSAEDLALNPVYHKRSKHIEIKYHWVREHVDPDGMLKTAKLIHVVYRLVKR